jgi:hypothetical protein
MLYKDKKFGRSSPRLNFAWLGTEPKTCAKRTNWIVTKKFLEEPEHDSDKNISALGGNALSWLKSAITMTNDFLSIYDRIFTFSTFSRPNLSWLQCKWNSCVIVSSKIGKVFILLRICIRTYRRIVLFCHSYVFGCKSLCDNTRMFFKQLLSLILEHIEHSICMQLTTSSGLVAKLTTWQSGLEVRITVVFLSA